MDDVIKVKQQVCLMIVNHGWMDWVMDVDLLIDE